MGPADIPASLKANCLLLVSNFIAMNQFVDKKSTLWIVYLEKVVKLH